MEVLVINEVYCHGITIIRPGTDMQADYHREVQQAESLYQTGDREGAFQVYLELGYKGYDEAQIMVGWSYLFALGVPKDLAEAIKWIRKAADTGNPKAAWYLGRIYCDLEDFEETRRWFELSAEKDFGPGVYRLGQLYYHGVGVPKSKAKAFEIFERGARAGNLRCQAIYARGLMVGYAGLSGIVKGVRLLAKTFIEISKIGSQNPDDIRLLC